MLRSVPLMRLLLVHLVVGDHVGQQLVDGAPVHLRRHRHAAGDVALAEPEEVLRVLVHRAAARFVERSALRWYFIHPTLPRL